MYPYVLPDCERCPVQLMKVEIVCRCVHVGFPLKNKNKNKSKVRLLESEAVPC